MASLAVHVAIAGWIATREPPAPRQHTEPVEIAVVVLDEPRREAELTEPAAPAAASAEAAPEERPRAPRKTSPSRAEVTTTSPSPTPNEPSLVSTPGPEAAPAVDAPAVAAEAAPSQPRKLDLSPLAAALTLRGSFETAPPGRCAAQPDGSCGTPGAQAAEAAAAVAPSAHERVIALRKELKLEPHSDGSYTYEGAGLRATVLPDGRVEFQDKIRDLNSLVEALASDGQRNTPAKRRFMAETAELREQLALAAEAKNQQRAQQRLRGVLEHVWHDASLSLAQKRAAIFSLWDDCASDASGSAAQARIEAFVREQLPLGTPLAFSASELAQLNRRRVSRRSFDPYAGADAGVLPG